MVLLFSVSLSSPQALLISSDLKAFGFTLRASALNDRPPGKIDAPVVRLINTESYLSTRWENTQSSAGVVFRI